MSVTDTVAPIKERQVKKALRNGLMGKMLMKLKIVINYLKSCKKKKKKKKKEVKIAH